MNPVPSSGFLTEEFSWRAVFLISVPIGLAVLVLGYRFVQESASKSIKSFDSFGQVLFILAISTLSAGVVMGPREGWLSLTIIMLFLVFVVSLGWFIYYELRNKHPMMDLRLFQNGRYAWAIASIFSLFFMVYGALLLATQYWQNIRDFSAIQSGLYLLPFAFFMILLPPRTGKYIARVGPVRPTKIGLLITIIGGIVMTLSFRTDFITALAFGILGIGVAFTGPALTTLAMSSVSSDRAGMASSIFSAQRAIGSTVGYAIMGSVLVAVAGLNLNSSLEAAVPDTAEREVITNAIAENANPHAFAAEIGPGRPIPSVPQATQQEVLDDAKGDFITGLQVSMAVGISLVLIMCMLGRYKFAKD